MLTSVVANVSALEARTTRQRRHLACSSACFCSCVSTKIWLVGEVEGVWSRGSSICRRGRRCDCSQAPRSGDSRQNDMHSGDWGASTFFVHFFDFLHLGLPVSRRIFECGRGARQRGGFAPRAAWRNSEGQIEGQERAAGTGEGASQEATYVQTSRPSLSDTAATVLLSVWVMVREIWGLQEQEPGTRQKGMR